MTELEDRVRELESEIRWQRGFSQGLLQRIEQLEDSIQKGMITIGKQIKDINRPKPLFPR